jgi:hypothetical protein
MAEADMETSDIKGFFKYRFKDIIIDIFREFGFVGVVTYVGGAIMLYHFPKQDDFNRQVLYAISGLALLTLATFISYFRIKAQREREKSLIEMVQNTGNRLAEQLGKNMTEQQVASIIQKIRQNQRDLFTAIFNNIK